MKIILMKEEVRACDRMTHDFKMVLIKGKRHYRCKSCGWALELRPR